MTALTRAMTEDELLTAITEAATYLGWRWHHIRRSDQARQMGHSGFPDLVLARKGRTMFLELKSAAGKATPDQVAWLDEIDPDVDQRLGYRNASAFVVKPEDLDLVLDLLR